MCRAPGIGLPAVRFRWELLCLHLPWGHPCHTVAYPLSTHAAPPPPPRHAPDRWGSTRVAGDLLQSSARPPAGLGAAPLLRTGALDGTSEGAPLLNVVFCTLGLGLTLETPLARNAPLCTLCRQPHCAGALQRSWPSFWICRERTNWRNLRSGGTRCPVFKARRKSQTTPAGWGAP